MPIDKEQISKQESQVDAKQSTAPTISPGQASYYPKDESGEIRPYFAYDNGSGVVEKRLAKHEDLGGGGGATALNDLSDVNAGSPSDGQSLVWDNATSKWIPQTISGGSTSISDAAYDATSWDGVTDIAPSKNAVRDKIHSMDSSIAANTSKVSADGTVNTHSDVDIAGITNGQVLAWNGSLNKFEPTSPSGGGDLLSSNNLSDVDSASTSLSNLGGTPLTDFNSHITPHAPDTAEENPTQVSSGEKTDGTETALRSFSPKDVADMASTHGGGGGSGIGTEYQITLGNGSTIADKINNAPTGGIPAGLTLVDGTDGSVHSQLAGSADDLIIIHGQGKVGAICGSNRGDSTFGGYLSIDLTNPGDLKTEDQFKNQTRLLGFNTKVGDNISETWLKLI